MHASLRPRTLGPCPMSDDSGPCNLHIAPLSCQSPLTHCTLRLASHRGCVILQTHGAVNNCNLLILSATAEGLPLPSTQQLSPNSHAKPGAMRRATKHDWGTSQNHRCACKHCLMSRKSRSPCTATAQPQQDYSIMSVLTSLTA